MLGLDFGGSKIAVAVAAADGRRLGQATVATDPSLGARRNLDRGVEAARILLREAVGGAELAAIGACTFGIPTSRGIGLAPAIAGWEELALGDELAAAFGCRTIRLATDVKAAAAAEASTGALAGHDPAVYLNLGTGLATAIVFGGRVVAGADGAAGEIGYNLVRPSDLNGSAHTVLEEVVSGTALSSAAARRTGAELTAADVFARASADPRLAALVDDFVRELSFHLVNLVVAINPSRVAVGGGMVRSWERLEAPLRRALEAGVPFPPDLVVGAFPYDAALVGAIALAIEAVGCTRDTGREESVNLTTVAGRPGRSRT